MNTIPLVDPERVTQNRVVNLLHDYCGYQYLGYKQDEDNSPIIPEILGRFLKESQGATQSEVDKIVRMLESEINRCHNKDTLFEANLKIYEYLRYGVNIQKEDGSGSVTYWLINWDKGDYAENIFSLAEEVTVRRNIPEYHTRRPDIVVYINGIAVGVIELKKSTVSVKDGIRQNIRNNGKDNEICHFFSTAQFLFAGNDSEGVYYGTILTPGFAGKNRPVRATRITTLNRMNLSRNFLGRTFPMNLIARFCRCSIPNGCLHSYMTV